MKLRRAVLGSLLRIGDDGHRLILHRYVLQSVLGLIPCLRNHHRNRVADVAHFVFGNGGMRRCLQVRVGYQPRAGYPVQRYLRVCARINCDDARLVHGLAGVD